MTNTIKQLWVASIVFAGIAVGSGSRAAHGSEGAVRGLSPQDAGSGTMSDKPERAGKADRVERAEKAEKADDSKASPKKTLTGCLRRSEDASKYNLTAQDGATWDLRSDSVNLNGHVGQAVTVTGVATDGKHGRMTVTDLTKVNDHCQK